MDTPTQKTYIPKLKNLTKTKKEYELAYEDKIYKFEFEVNNNEIKFILTKLSEISYYNYIRKYNYDEIINDLNLSKDFDNIEKIFEYLDIKGCEIFDDIKNKKLVINNKETIILYENENKNEDIIKILIDEINKIKKICNELKNMNEDKENQIKEIKNKLLNLNGINLKYELDKEWQETNIF